MLSHGEEEKATASFCSKGPTESLLSPLQARIG